MRKSRIAFVFPHSHCLGAGFLYAVNARLHVELGLSLVCVYVWVRVFVRVWFLCVNEKNV